MRLGLVIRTEKGPPRKPKGKKAWPRVCTCLAPVIRPEGFAHKRFLVAAGFVYIVVCQTGSRTRGRGRVKSESDWDDIATRILRADFGRSGRLPTWVCTI
jgi:hypothetical protein